MHWSPQSREFGGAAFDCGRPLDGTLVSGASKSRSSSESGFAATLATTLRRAVSGVCRQKFCLRSEKPSSPGAFHSSEP